MRILICVPSDLAAPRGNSVASRRLARGFERAGHAVAVLERCEGMANAKAAARVRGAAIDAILLMHAWRCAGAFWAIRSVCAAPAVVSLRGTDVNEMLGDARLGPEVRAVLAASAAIAVFSEPMRSAVAVAAPECAEKLHVIPNGLSVEDSPIDYRARLGIPPGATVFVALGGLRAVKRTAWVAARIADLHAEFPAARFVHAGPEIERDAAVELAAVCQPNSCLHHLGPIPHEEAAAFLRAGDIFVSASRSEGMPHAVREAMLLRLPPLLSAIEGHLLMAEPEREALFFEDAASFERQAQRLMVDADLRARIGANARERVRAAARNDDEIGGYLRLLEETGARQA